MRKALFIFSVALAIPTLFASAQGAKSYALQSPDGHLRVSVYVDTSIRWSISAGDQITMLPSQIGMQLDNRVIGEQARVISAKSRHVNEVIAALNYKKDTINNNYNQLLLACRGDFTVEFRVYDDGAAYRFSTVSKDSLRVIDEIAEFNFAGDDSAYIPYSNDPHNKDKFQCSFENTYRHIPLSQFVRDTVAFAPVLVESSGAKVIITEADLENYPGMFLTNTRNGNGLRGAFARYALEQVQNERNPVQALVTRRGDFIARTAGQRSFPWRVVIVAQNDRDLLNNDMVYRLASPSRVADPSWIRPGKVAWDWWNDWNISHVNFKAGINTETYKYYVDFAAASHIDYILLDEGWSDDRDIMKVTPAIDLPGIISYAATKHVGVWLWMGSFPLDEKMKQIFDTYPAMGVKGFKIDFMDRDDQNMVEFYYKVAKAAADHHIMIDFHGAYKPTGLQRTYPNVVNVEGVHGMEQLKWSNPDMPAFDVSIPFIRMVAGPMDYTPGAMRNATKESFRPVNSMPMSQGTRCHQLAMYVMYEAPFEMLSDNPTAYMNEKECLDFISSVPTTFSRTVAVNGRIGQYAVIARRKSDTWYVAAMTNWNARDLSIDLSFLPPGRYSMDGFQDGINADRDATDYSRRQVTIDAGEKVNIHLAPGGGWAAKISPAK